MTVLFRWLALLVASALLAGLLDLLRLPAALLIGPMIAGIAAGAMGARMRVARPLASAAFSIIGVMIAASIEPSLFSGLLSDWPIVVGATVATLVASSVLGWQISRMGVLPGTTAIWGSAPGAAAAMVLMAEAFGADARLVAFMQYVRVIMVSIAAALISRLFVDTSAVSSPAVEWFPPLVGSAFAATLLAAFAGSVGGRLLRLPSPDFIGPMIVGIVLHAGGGVAFQLPEWLLAATYLVVGWSIGLRFDRETLLYSLRSLPYLMLSVLALIAFCGGIAWILARYMGIDPLTAYLATSPGGLDTVAIIAVSSSNVDVSLVIAAQTLRFLIVLLLGPPIVRWLARRANR